MSEGHSQLVLFVVSFKLCNYISPNLLTLTTIKKLSTTKRNIGRSKRLQLIDVMYLGFKQLVILKNNIMYKYINVSVFDVSGENPAAMQHGGGTDLRATSVFVVIVTLLLSLLR